MNIDELEKLKKGARLLDEINSYKWMIDDIEKAMNESGQIESSVLYTDGANKIRVPLTKEVTLKALAMAIEEYKSTIARLEKEFDEL